ncbi:glucan endo-1,3-beta-glucosidase 5-like [Phragmites australis]|uniref:glucan endo-1,3-beta-glucosidase 5-like n=1 Tax=Phragmites australis TaxID=29695 RepID=UPI002D7A147F|nr:glucan endo-1,3-beta-glucosidase 5-like [Phragmites australis]
MLLFLRHLLYPAHSQSQWQQRFCSSHPLPKDPTFVSHPPWSPTKPPPKAPSLLPPMAAAVTVVFVAFLAALPLGAEAAVGVNWGTVSAHRMPAPVVVELMRANRIAKVKLFDADPAVLRALAGSGVQVMVGIGNEMLAGIAESPTAADAWVAHNVSRYVGGGGGVDIRYIAVGNEPFLTSYQGQFQSYVLPAMTNIQQSLVKANLASYIKLVVPCNADAYQSASVPSQGVFRPDLTRIMTQLAAFLSSTGAPFMVNIYPFLSLYQSSDFPQDYAFFDGSSHPVVDGSNVYYNAFDGNFDTLVSALSKIGYGQLPIAIGEVGWPTEGAPSANLTAARAFNQGLISRVLSNEGTPLRPGIPPVDVYLFSLLDEEQKSILPGNFERHWGIFSFDGQAKYPLNLGLGNPVLKNARDVPYLPPRWCVTSPGQNLNNVENHLKLACTMADCTPLYYGGLCNAIGDKGNISYAFNSYYQLQKQDAKSCDFDGLGMVVHLDPSIGECRFLVGIDDNRALAISSSSGSSSPVRCGLWILTFWVLVWLKIVGSF